ncbi:MAG: hypothetical protein H0U03_00565 [Actinobacteria bacterium]|nr:hypothetical protein [Actinomycetota bacterium]
MHHPAIDRLWRKISAVPAWAVLTALICVSAALRFLATKDVPVPWIAPDEMIYGTLGQSLYRAGELAILGGPTPFYSLVYPALVGLPLSLSDLELGYSILKALQALVISLCAVPVYLWGRSLMNRGWALLAAALSLAIPGLAYSGLIMSEVAFYPIITLTAWAMARALVVPTAMRQAALVGAIALASATRLQALVLLPVLFTALALKALLERRARPLLQFWPTLAALVALAAAWVTWRLASGGPWSEVFAGYRAAGEASYSLSGALEFVGYHVGDALLLSGIFPACALVLLVIDAVTGREQSEEARAYLAVTVSLALWLVTQVGVFASQHVDRLAERNLLALAPLFFIGFALWLDRGAARPRVRTSIVAFVAAVPVLSLPVKRFISEGALPDALTLVPFYRLLLRDPEINLELVIFGGATAAVALFALLPRRFVVVLPLVLLLAFTSASVAASRHVTEQAALQQRKLVGPDRRWIDRAVSEPVAYLHNGDFYWNSVWEIVFWNRQVKRVYDLPGARVPGPLPQRRVDVLGDGRVVLPGGAAAPSRYVVASTVYTFVGSPVKSIAQEGIEQAGLVLWRLDPPFRLSTAMSGVRPNSEIRGYAQLVAYACDKGKFKVTLTGLAPGEVRAELKQNGVLLRVRSSAPRETLWLDQGESWSGSIPAKPSGPRARSTCTLEVFSSNLIATSRFHFERR